MAVYDEDLAKVKAYRQLFFEQANLQEGEGEKGPPGRGLGLQALADELLVGAGAGGRHAQAQEVADGTKCAHEGVALSQRLPVLLQRLAAPGVFACTNEYNI